MVGGSLLQTCWQVCKTKIFSWKMHSLCMEGFIDFPVSRSINNGMREDREHISGLRVG